MIFLWDLKFLRASHFDKFSFRTVSCLIICVQSVSTRLHYSTLDLEGALFTISVAKTETKGLVNVVLRKHCLLITKTEVVINYNMTIVVSNQADIFLVVHKIRTWTEPSISASVRCVEFKTHLTNMMQNPWHSFKITIYDISCMALMTSLWKVTN